MVLLLFDIDGTLAPSAQQITTDMLKMLTNLSKLYNLGLVGGGTYDKIMWQMNDRIDMFKYVFAECGSVVYKNGGKILEKNMMEYVERKLINRIIKKCLRLIADFPVLHNGHMVDVRNGLIYVSPSGMQANLEERSLFIEADNKHRLRDQMIEKLKKIDTDDKLEIVKGGQTGISIYPKGWNKAQVVEMIEDDETIHFFGDRTEPDGNDYPLYIHPRVIGHSVKSWNDTYKQLLPFLL